MLDEALEQDLIVRNPARKLSFPETRKPRKTVLSEAEIGELLGDLEGRDRLIVRMFLVLALRPGELLHFDAAIVSSPVNFASMRACQRNWAARTAS